LTIMSQISNIYEVKIPKKLSAILGLDRAEGGGRRAEGGGRRAMSTSTYNEYTIKLVLKISAHCIIHIF
ncbi:MAG TPA: hypothetical protein PLW33_06175, partial [Candidatus Cloacimonas sp.]|nr:hypothetical protein [Candidatus Cloacimonas sp.]